MNSLKDDSKAGSDQMPSGYAAPLFNDRKPWTDDRMVGGSSEKAEHHEHDKKLSSKILDGLCFDPFFKAEDVSNEKYKDIPDCTAPVKEIPKPADKPQDRQQHQRSKPLDSKYHKRKRHRRG